MFYSHFFLVFLVVVAVKAGLWTGGLYFGLDCGLDFADAELSMHCAMSMWWPTEAYIAQ